MSYEQIIWNFLISLGLTAAGAAGLLGNIKAESGCIPNNMQNSYESALGMTDESYTAAVDNGTYTNFENDRVGYGICQWTVKNRKAALLLFAKERGSSIGDIYLQLDFLKQELETLFSKTYAVLKTAKTVEEASDQVLLDFERPKDQSEANLRRRSAIGQALYDKYANEKGGTSKMKYSKSNPPLVCMQTTSTCYKGTGTMDVKGVLWHSTGANNPYIKRYVQPSDNASDRAAMLKLLGVNTNGNDWNHVSHQAGLNCWIGKLADGTVTTVQTMPWNYRPWGCGSGSRGSCNRGWIQFEINHIVSA